MSSDRSYYNVNVTSTCESDHDLVYAVLDSAFYNQDMPISEPLDINYSDQYVTTDATAINNFTEISDYYHHSPFLNEADYSTPPQNASLQYHSHSPSPYQSHDASPDLRSHMGSPDLQSHQQLLQPIYAEVTATRSVSLPVDHRRTPSPWSPDSVQSEQTAHSVHSPAAVHPPDPVTPAPQSTRGEFSPNPQYHLTPAPTPLRHRQAASLSSLPDLQPQSEHKSQPTRQWTPIAPNPIGLRQLQGAGYKRPLDTDDDEWDILSTKKTRRSSSSSPNIEMTEEDTLLLRLKDDEGLTWKEIATRFQDEMGKSFQVPALQMRLKRLRERMRVWTEVDIQALRLAHEYWMNSKFEIIAAKMSEYGSTERWSPKQCSRKWQELSWTTEMYSHPMLRTPTFSTSYTASPIEGPGHGFYHQLPITTS